MLRLYDKQIVYKEVPDEISLALSFSECPRNCEGCHTPDLSKSMGEHLTPHKLEEILQSTMSNHVSCILFYGGEWDCVNLNIFSVLCKSYNKKIALYTGANTFEELDQHLLGLLDYVKLGEYKKEFGGLESKKTNQRFYKRVSCGWEDLTYIFWR